MQLGGGIRDMAGDRELARAGVRRVILGSAAVKNPALVRQACRTFPGRIASASTRATAMVATEGWAETSSIRALDLALRFEDAGVAAIVYTDIGARRDAVGRSISRRQRRSRLPLTTPVIASGGVGSLEDLRRRCEPRRRGRAGGSRA